MSDAFEAWWAPREAVLREAHAQLVRELAMHPPGEADIARMKERARRGHLKHGGDITTWPPERLARERIEEIDDARVYGADGIVRGWVTSNGW